ncbi:MAG: ATP-binding protein [Pelobium sp.]
MASKISWRIPSLNASVTETSLFQAQLKLFYLMLGANVYKGLIYLFDAVANHQGDGSNRAIRLMVTSIIIIFVLRRFPKILTWGIHYAVIATILHVYYRVFNTAVGTDVVALQAIFMIIISAFYGLGKKWGTIYSIIAFASLILYHHIPYRFVGLQPLPENLNDAYIVINCIVIVMAHIYFHAVIFGNLNNSKLQSEKMSQLAQTKSDFLSTMSHELRTPLNSVIGIASLLISDNTNTQQKEQLDVLKFSAEGLLSLINDILDINKIESGKLELENAAFDLERLLKGITAAMQFKAEEKVLQLNLEIDDQIKEKMFLGDVSRLSQVLYNLVGNAIKFTEKGQVKLSAKVLSIENGDHSIRFEVEDSGIGISTEQQDIIFEPFLQATANTNRKFGGTGLGLSIVKQLVVKFGSQIKMRSELGKGAVFYFDLLIKETVKEKQESINTTKNGEETDLSQLNVLLAEDNMMNIFFMKQLFKKWNITADIAENGEEVLQLIKKKDYDVILMDMHMPVLDGIETTKIIRALKDSSKANTYIIALTASVSDNIIKQTKDYGINDYLSKPFPLDDLFQRLVKRQQIKSL